MGRLRGRGLGGLCSSAQGAPTWASTAHGGHSRDGPAVAVYGGTDTGVTQQPHVGAQAELSRAPRRGLSAADSEVWVGTVSVCLRAGLCTATLTLPPGPQHHVPSAGRGILPPPTLLPPAGGCQQRHSAPSPTGFLLYPPEDATISWQHFGAADALCMGPVWGPWHPLGAQQTHYLHPTAPSPREGPSWFVTAPHTSAAGGHLCPVCASSALPTAVAPHSTEGPSSAFPAPCREQHEGIWGQQRPWAAGGALGRLRELGRSLHVAQAGSARAVQCRCPQPALSPARPVPTVGSALGTALQPTQHSCTPPQARSQPMGIAAPPVPITQNTWAAWAHCLGCAASTAPACTTSALPTRTAPSTLPHRTHSTILLPLHTALH